MKLSNLITLFLAGVLTITNTYGQANASLNILTLNSGGVSLGGTVDIQVTVGNTGPVSSIGVNKVRAQISIPIAIASALSNVQQTGLPAGWTILSNTGGVITVCNGSDVIPVGAQRQVLIKVQGNTIGGPSTVAGALSFGPGTGVCTGLGSLAGDITADNTSTSTITVTSTLPVTLMDFTAKTVSCLAELHWTTAAEINSEKFEIERSDAATFGWGSIGTVAANGNTTTKSEYSFTDRNATGSASDNLLYRLKMIDKDGLYKYSGVLRVNINCNTTKAAVFPNPVQNGKLYISLTGSGRFTEATLQSLSGQVLLRSKIATGTTYLDVSAFADGIYLLNIKDENGFDKNVKVFIQR